MEKERKRDKAKQISLEKKVLRLQKVRPTEVKKKVKAILEKRMSSANVKMFLNPEQKWARYSSRDKVEALVLHAINRKCYNQVRKFNQISLPSESTLKRWLGEFDCSPGYQEDAIRCLKIMLNETKLKHYDMAALTLDEIDIRKKRVEIDMKAQRVYGPFNKSMTVMVRGLVQH